jgi:Protein of unknown function (DUF4242)
MTTRATRYPEITWEHNHVVITNDPAVKTYCLYDAPSEEIVRRHAEALGLHDVEGLYEAHGRAAENNGRCDGQGFARSIASGSSRSICGAVACSAAST